MDPRQLRRSNAAYTGYTGLRYQPPDCVERSVLWSGTIFCAIILYGRIVFFTIKHNFFNYRIRIYLIYVISLQCANYCVRKILYVRSSLHCSDLHLGVSKTIFYRESRIELKSHVARINCCDNNEIMRDIVVYAIDVHTNRVYFSIFRRWREYEITPPAS